MLTKVWRVKEQVKRVDTGEKVTVVEILPQGLRVFYRVEYENGDHTLVMDGVLRECN